MTMVKDRMGDLKARRPSIFKSIKESVRRKSFRRKNTVGNFLEDVSAIDKTLTKLRDGVAEMKRLQADILCTPDADKKLHTDLARNNSQNRALSANIRKIINELRENYETSGDNTSSEKSKASEQVVRNQLERLTSELVETVNDWSSAQASYNDKVKDRLKRQYSIVGESKTEKELSDLLAEDQTHAVFTQDIIKEIQDAQMVLDQVQEREREIFKLEKSVVQVHELFSDFQILVSEQGEKLDRVEQNVETARVDVEAGSAKLKQAKVYKKKSRKKKLIIASIVVLVVLVVAAIIVVAVVTG